MDVSRYVDSWKSVEWLYIVICTLILESTTFLYTAVKTEEEGTEDYKNKCFL